MTKADATTSCAIERTRTCTDADRTWQQTCQELGLAKLQHHVFNVTQRLVAQFWRFPGKLHKFPSDDANDFYAAGVCVT